MEQNSVQNLEKKPASMDETIQSAIVLCQGRAEEKGLCLHVACEPGLTASIHVGLIVQALLNLIDNAINYGATAEHPSIDISASLDGQGVVITVRDYGNGIAAEHQDRIFERFYRVDKGRSREMGGTGLGLSIVKHIALIHGGTVSVKSEPGRGSVFTMILPV